MATMSYRYIQGIMFLLAVIVTAQVAARPTGEAISCQKITSSLIPCVSYLTRGGVPLTACCGGVRGLKNIATTTATRRAVCNCIQEAATRIKSIKKDAASQLFARCGAKLASRFLSIPTATAFLKIPMMNGEWEEEVGTM